MRISPLTSLANNKQMQKFVKWSNIEKIDKNWHSISNLSLVKKHFPCALTVVLSSLFINDTLKSKEIPKDKKKSLVNFYIANCAIIIAGTYAIMPSVARFTKTLGERFNKVNMQNTERVLLEKGMKSMIPIVAIGITSRVLSPIIGSWFSGNKNKKQ